MQKTKIPWADYTWNPIRGCSPVSEGCANCYAARMASRFSGPGKPFEGLADGGCWTGEIKDVSEGSYKNPRKPSRIFVCSVSDLFHERAGFHPLYSVLVVASAHRQHTFIALTKRPERLMLAWKIHASNGFPTWPDNFWVGVSVENHIRAGQRIPLLFQIPAAKRFISVEPMLGPVELTDRWLGFGETEPAPNKLDWVICGCESGPARRPFNPAWARRLRYQCQNAGIPFFYKQGPDKNGRIVDMPELDGRVWDQVPEK